MKKFKYIIFNEDKNLYLETEQKSPKECERLCKDMEKNFNIEFDFTTKSNFDSWNNNKNK